MNPGEVTVAAAELAELGLLANPEDSQRQEAHQVGEQVRRERAQHIPDRVLGGQRAGRPQRPGRMERIAGPHRKTEHQQRQRHREDAIAECGQALQAHARYVTVADRHGPHHTRRLAHPPGASASPAGQDQNSSALLSTARGIPGPLHINEDGKEIHVLDVDHRRDIYHR